MLAVSGGFFASLHLTHIHRDWEAVGRAHGLCYLCISGNYWHAGALVPGKTASPPKSRMIHRRMMVMLDMRLSFHNSQKSV